jgi:hypothetical protein
MAYPQNYDESFRQFCNDILELPEPDNFGMQDYTVPPPGPRPVYRDANHPGHNVFPGAAQQIFQPAPAQFNAPPMPTQYAPLGYVFGSQVQGYPPNDPSIYPAHTTQTVGQVTSKFFDLIHMLIM